MASIAPKLIDPTHLYKDGSPCYYIKPYGKDRARVLLPSAIALYNASGDDERREHILAHFNHLVYSNSLTPYDQKLEREMHDLFTQAMGLEHEAMRIRQQARQKFWDKQEELRKGE